MLWNAVPGRRLLYGWHGCDFAQRRLVSLVRIRRILECVEFRLLLRNPVQPWLVRPLRLHFSGDCHVLVVRAGHLQQHLGCWYLLRDTLPGRSVRLFWRDDVGRGDLHCLPWRHVQPARGLDGVRWHALCGRILLSQRVLRAGLLGHHRCDEALLRALPGGYLLQCPGIDRVRRYGLPRRPVRANGTDVRDELFGVPCRHVLVSKRQRVMHRHRM